MRRYYLKNNPAIEISFFPNRTNTAWIRKIDDILQRRKDDYEFSLCTYDGVYKRLHISSMFLDSSNIKEWEMPGSYDSIKTHITSGSYNNILWINPKFTSLGRSSISGYFLVGSAGIVVKLPSRPGMVFTLEDRILDRQFQNKN